MHAETELEFEALRAVCGRYVRSSLGREELAQVAPLSDRGAIENALIDAAEAIEYLRATTQPQPAARGSAIRVRFEGVADPGSSLARLRIEGVTLEPNEIFELARLLDLAAEARSILLAAREKYPRLAA
ncbi:MAG: endonuclease MutS2, partial [Acidobacteria bacterium]